MTAINKALQSLTENPDQRLERSDLIHVADEILGGEVSPPALSAFLMGLRMQGETGNEVEPFVSSMLHHATSFPPHESDEPVIDTCGTGGDGRHTFNISTTAAFIVAAAGIKVAKHGNRSASSKCGSADVLAELGLDLEQTPEAAANQLKELNFCFLYARSYHKAMRFAAEARQAMKVRTLFNLCGPLSNPALPTHQLVGVASQNLVQPMVDTLKRLGRQRALVVHGADGLDEISTVQDTYGQLLEANGSIHNWELSPRDLDLKPVEMSELVGGDAEENKEITLQILKGQKGAKADVTNLNAAAAIWLARGEDSFEQSFARARSIQESGAAFDLLNQILKAQS